MDDQIVEQRDSSCELIRLLRRLEGEEAVILRTIGGFQFDGGRLVRVDDWLADATDVDVRFPGGASIGFSNITVNLCALISIGVDD